MTNSVITQKEEWTRYLNKSFTFDFCHTWYYHSLSKIGHPLLFVYHEQDDFVAVPLLKRAIKGTNLYDLTAVYGYSGPISNKPFNVIQEDMMLNFENSFKEFMKAECCICVFSRLNPFIGQSPLLEKIGSVCCNGKTIYMDLQQSLEEQRAKYNKRLLRQIRQLRKESYEIKEADSQEEIGVFTRMYIENMDRLSASKDYYFDEDYFSKMLQSNELNSKLLLIYHGTEMICGAIVICSMNVIRNHLSATNKDYLKESPSKLLTDEISIVGRNLGMKYFHLGGGVGGKEDSLFAFKASFSNLYLDDHLWCLIADQEAYTFLVNKEKIEVDTSFFPLYRAVPVY
ncbi:GNAT family N-acetyltransferase [Arcticibacter eurypsychrophilus]|uniref:GNAT family N-acetyltransferase n=1 Tax=Arcticibacter eurypsychrophilus TaxID=1434752 RepID=UPI00084DAF50|nr:GNAT family N-acetyltransferase [Arcticibacter eurypsychrophilus]